MVVGTEMWIYGAPLVELWRVGIERGPHVEHRRTLLVLDLDRLDRLERGGLVLGSDRRDRLAAVADIVLREQWLVGGNAEGLQVAIDVLRHVPVRDHGAHSWHPLGLTSVQARA